MESTVNGNRESQCIPSSPQPSIHMFGENLDGLIEAHASDATLEDLVAEKSGIVSLIAGLTGGGKEKPDVIGKEREEAPYHWKFLIKEMMWMSEDFAKERRRHQTRSRKMSKSIEMHFKGQEARI